jgi:Ca2+-binding EF-hand superfamily protein
MLGGCKGKGKGVTKSSNSGGNEGGRASVERLILQLFRTVDVDNSGFIDEREMEVALQAFGTVGEMLGYQIDYSFASMDTDHSGGVDEAEFANALLAMEEMFGPRKCIEVLNSLISEAESILKLVSHRRIRSDGPPGRVGQCGHSSITAHASVPKDAQPCPNCGRMFSPESMEIHLRSCGGVHGGSKLARSQLQGNTRKERNAFEAMHQLMQISSRDPKLSAKLRQSFTKLDMDGNGTLNREEFQIVYANLKTPGPSLEDLMSQYDANHDGVIQFAEFERLMKWAIK